MRPCGALYGAKVGARSRDRGCGEEVQEPKGKNLGLGGTEIESMWLDLAAFAFVCVSVLLVLPVLFLLCSRCVFVCICLATFFLLAFMSFGPLKKKRSSVVLM